MSTEVLSFDAMPQMIANILKKLKMLEQKFDALQSNNNVEADAWLMLSARKSTAEIYDEARAYVANNPMRRGR
jgi:putative excisionase